MSLNGPSPGYLGEGGDIEEGEMTIDEAHQRALELVPQGCKGFTFEGSPDDESGNMLFKDHFDYFEGEGWVSYQIEVEDDEKTPMLDARTTEDGNETTKEPPCLQPFVCTTHVFDGIGLQSRPGDGVFKMEMSAMEEEVLGEFQCTEAIITSYCSILTCGLGECCTHRSETTNSVKLTTKRIQINLDEAEGCWPTTDEDNPSIGNPICGCCCLAPSGCIQTKVLGIMDIAGYAREVTVPKVQILSSMRIALSCWSLAVVVMYCVMVMTTAEGQTAASGVATNVAGSEWVTNALNNSAFNNSVGGALSDTVSGQAAQEEDLSTLPIVLMGFAVVALLSTILYVLLDQVLKYGWKFVALVTILLAPIGVAIFMNLDKIVEHMMSPEVAERLAPYQCLRDVFAKAGLAAATLPIWLLLAWLYIINFGVRQYKLRINFANQVTYTLVMRETDIDNITRIFSETLAEEGTIEKNDVAGAGLFNSEVDMPVNIPGKLLHKVDYTGGGGLVLSNVALASHSEVYSFGICGPEIYQLSEVYIHSPRVMASLMTKLEYTTNLMPRYARRLFYFLGTLFLLAGVTLAIRDFTAPKLLGDGSPSGAPMYYADGTPRFGIFLAVFALFIILFPKLTGCCVSKVGIDFTWGTIVLYLTLGSNDAEDLMTFIISATCRPGIYLDPEVEYGEESLGDFEESAAASCVSPIRTLQITDLRVKITDDKTSISYPRSGLTEVDMGPEEWMEKCFGVCPISGWQRPNRDGNAPLSMNFGWQKGLPGDSFPGTQLAMTERMTFTYEDCMTICQIIDKPFGEFVHHMWCPVKV